MGVNLFRRVLVTAADLYGVAPVQNLKGFPNSFDLREVKGTKWTGISIDPESQYRAVTCWFDDDKSTPYTLVAGRPLRKSFNSVRVLPAEEYTRVSGAAGWAGMTAPPALLSVGVLALRLWEDVSIEESGFSRVMHFMQEEQVGGTAVHPDFNWLHVHLPAPQTLELWYSYGTVAQPGAATLKLYGCRPARALGVWSTPRRAKLLGSIAVVAGATDDDEPLEKVVRLVNPEYTEYLARFEAVTDSINLRLGMVASYAADYGAPGAKP